MFNKKLGVIFPSIIYISLSAMEYLEEKQGVFVWGDLEMSNIDLDAGRILELALIITDGRLNVIAEGPNIAIHQPEGVLTQASEWVKKNIPQALKESQNSKISIEQAEQEAIKFLLQHTNATNIPALKNNNPLLAGNCVQTDLQFLAKYMPQFTQYLNYRIVDVSTIAEIIKQWYPTQVKYKIEADINKIKTRTHRAMQDIRESIKELQYYRENVFKLEEDLEEQYSQNNESEQNKNHYILNHRQPYGTSFHPFLVTKQ